LSFGSQVKIVSPESLLGKVKEEAKRIVGAYR
jgi:predicted DNA-binding transcriptional regulator YafY